MRRSVVESQQEEKSFLRTVALQLITRSILHLSWRHGERSGCAKLACNMTLQALRAIITPVSNKETETELDSICIYCRYSASIQLQRAHMLSEVAHAVDVLQADAAWLLPASVP